jgi:hypothetical protein
MRIADSIFSAKLRLACDRNHLYSAIVTAGHGTPASTAASTVKHSSPESATRPSTVASVGSCASTWALRSSSREEITLPRRHTSAMSGSGSS